MNEVTSRIDISGSEPADGFGGEIGTNVEAAMEEALGGTKANVVRDDLLFEWESHRLECRHEALRHKAPTINEVLP